MGVKESKNIGDYKTYVTPRIGKSVCEKEDTFTKLSSYLSTKNISKVKEQGVKKKDRISFAKLFKEKNRIFNIYNKIVVDSIPQSSKFNLNMIISLNSHAYTPKEFNVFIDNLVNKKNFKTIHQNSFKVIESIGRDPSSLNNQNVNYLDTCYTSTIHSTESSVPYLKKVPVQKASSSNNSTVSTLNTKVKVFKINKNEYNSQNRSFQNTNTSNVSPSSHSRISKSPSAQDLSTPNKSINKSSSSKTPTINNTKSREKPIKEESNKKKTFKIDLRPKISKPTSLNQNNPNTKFALNSPVNNTQSTKGSVYNKISLISYNSCRDTQKNYESVKSSEVSSLNEPKTESSYVNLMKKKKEIFLNFNKSFVENGTKTEEIVQEEKPRTKRNKSNDNLFGYKPKIKNDLIFKLDLSKEEDDDHITNYLVDTDKKEKPFQSTNKDKLNILKNLKTNVVHKDIPPYKKPNLNIIRESITKENEESDINRFSQQKRQTPTFENENRFSFNPALIEPDIKYEFDINENIKDDELLDVELMD